MRIIVWDTVEKFIEKHADSDSALRAWRTQIQDHHFAGPADILNMFPYASIINDQRVVFNIRGNNYRLVVAVHYDRNRLYVRGVLTHAEYNKVDVTTI